jgi:hypothetical protein
MPESTHVVGTDTAYPADASTDDNGTVTDLKYFCAAHGEDVPCADCETAEVAAFQTAAHYTAYVSASYTWITTFGGSHLARVRRHWLGSRKLTPTGGTYRTAYVQAVSHNGTVRWHGQYNHDSGNLITLHRSKGTPG